MVPGVFTGLCEKQGMAMEDQEEILTSENWNEFIIIYFHPKVFKRNISPTSPFLTP